MPADPIGRRERKKQAVRNNIIGETIQLVARHGVEGTTIDAICDCADINIMDGDTVASFAEENAIDFVIIGPEAPLAAGVADRLRDAGLLVFGPSKAAAALEASKSFTKEICDAANAPTAGYGHFHDVAVETLDRVGVQPEFDRHMTHPLQDLLLPGLVPERNRPVEFGHRDLLHDGHTIVQRGEQRVINSLDLLADPLEVGRGGVAVAHRGRIQGTTGVASPKSKRGSEPGTRSGTLPVP